MRRIRFMMLVAVLALIAVLAAISERFARKRAVTLIKVRLRRLGERIHDLQGRVVVVDFWAEYCQALQARVSQAGRIAIASMRVRGCGGFGERWTTPPTPERSRTSPAVFSPARKQALCQFPAGREAAGLVIQVKGARRCRCVLSFNRRGELLKKYGDGVDYAEIERLVLDALKQ